MRSGKAIIDRLIWLGILPAVVYLYCQLYFPGESPALLSHYALQAVLLTLVTFSLGSAAFGAGGKRIRSCCVPLSFGAGIWVVAAVMESLEVILQQPPYGTVADGFWVAGYLAMLTGLWRSTRVFDGWRTPRSIRAGAIWLGLAAIEVSLVVRYVMPRPDRELVFVLGCFYHASDILLVYLALVAAFGRDAAGFRALLFLMVPAFFLFYLMDLIVILKEVTAPFDQWSAAGYSVSYVLLFLVGRKAAAAEFAGSKV